MTILASPPTASTTVPPAPRRRPIWWHPFHSLFCLLFGAYMLYVLVTLVAVAADEWDHVLPPQIDGLIRSTLLGSSVIAAVFAAGTTIRAMISRCTTAAVQARAADQKTREDWQADCTAWMVNLMDTVAAIKANAQAGETTVDLGRRRGLYAGVAVLQPGTQEVVDRAAERLVETVRVRLAEEYVAGGQAVLDQIAVGAGGNVTRLPQMRA